MRERLEKLARLSVDTLNGRWKYFVEETDIWLAVVPNNLVELPTKTSFYFEGELEELCVEATLKKFSNELAVYTFKFSVTEY